MRYVHWEVIAQAEKATLISERGLYLWRQLPTLPRSCSAGAPARVRPMARDSSRTFRRLKSLHFGCVQVTDRFDLLEHTHESQIQSQRQRARAPALHDSSRTFRRLKSSHFGCVQVTDRFDLLADANKVKGKVKVNGSGRGRPLYTFAIHIT